jgi:hypothetical protein
LISKSTAALTCVRGTGNRSGVGAGIANESTWMTLTITDSTITHNTVDRGGGIYNVKGTVILNGVTFSNNLARSDGGGIGNFDALVLNAGTEVTQNSSWVDIGGGISNVGTVRLNPGSSVSNNYGGNCYGGTGCPG